MFRLAKEDVKEFQLLYKRHFGVELNYGEAEAEGLKVIRLVAMTQPKDIEMGMDNGNEPQSGDKQCHAPQGGGHGTRLSA